MYEALWERAQTEPLNRTQVPVAYEVSSCNIENGFSEFMIIFFQASIKPILQRGQRLAAAVGIAGAKL